MTIEKIKRKKHTIWKKIIFLSKIYDNLAPNIDVRDAN